MGMRKLARLGLGSLVSLSLLASCTQKSREMRLGQSDPSLRPLSEAERAEDFDALAHAVQNFYGPLEYKQKKFSFQLTEIVTEYRTQALAAKDDAEAFGVFKKFLARLQDGHVNIRSELRGDQSYAVPIFITPVENRALIASISDNTLSEQLGINRYDEVLEIDGQKPFDFLPVIRKYEAMGNEISDRHLLHMALQRPTFMTELKPTKPTVLIKFEKPDGTVFERTLVWSIVPSPLAIKRKYVAGSVLRDFQATSAAPLIQATLEQFGEDTPFFANPVVEGVFQFTRVAPSAKFLQAYSGTNTGSASPLYAALYKFKGRMILLVRQGTYAVGDSSERIAWFKAVMDEYGRLADVLVIDQTHNPGGMLSYTTEFVSLFAREGTRGLVHFLHADRKWLSTLGGASLALSGIAGFAQGELRKVFELGYSLVERAYDRNETLSERPIPLEAFDFIKPADFVFNKPILMLVDELSGSGGDIAPLLMKENGLATLFGQRTMGLGGTVEPILNLPASQATVNLTRGMFAPFSPDGKYDFDKMPENNGVTPDIAYEHTVEDVRDGYLGYVQAFSQAAIDVEEKARLAADAAAEAATKTAAASAQ